MKRKYLKRLIISGMIFSSCIFTSSFYAQENGVKTFNVLTYNVAGLPGVLSSSDPENNTYQISSLLNKFDIIAVQEDFAYHQTLISQVIHPYLSKHSGNVPIGDGMNFLSKYPLQDISRIKWQKTHGIFTNGSDQLTPKGFAYTKVQLEDGVYIDFYTMHTDADTDDGSLEARRDNMRQLAQYIQDNSAGNAVIVMGDTNSRYTRAGDNFETALLESCGLQDAWIELMRNGSIPQDGDALMDANNRNSGNNEVVDKVFYRSNEAVNLQAINYCLDEFTFTDAQGKQLSDHYPVTVTFGYTVNNDLTYSQSYGGSGGISFNSLSKQNGLNKIKKIALRSGTRIDGLSLTYDNGETFTVGGTGGDIHELALNDNEYITSVIIGKGKKNSSSTERVIYIDITTNLGHHLTGGTFTTDKISLVTPNNCNVVGFWGRAEAEIDQLGVIYKK